MAAEDDRALGYRVVDLVVQHLEGLADGPAFRPVPPGLAAQFQAGPVPELGSPAGDVLRDFAETVEPYPFGNGHPRFWGWVNSPPQLLGVYAEALAAAMNPSVAGGNHAAVHVERQVIRWFCELAGFPTTAFGLLTSGGSMATLTALATARHRAAARAGIDVRAQGMNTPGVHFTLYVGSEGHSSAKKAAELLGIGSDNIRTIASDRDRRMDPADLRNQLERDVRAGLVPIAVMGSVGTVNTGAIDPIGALAEVCARYDTWLHVDGAYGAVAVLFLESFGEARAGVARADSITLDPHKWLYAPVDAGMVLFRDGDSARRAFSLIPDYLRTDGDDHGVTGPPWLSEYGFEQTRPFRALKVWMLIKHLGLDGYRALIAKDIALADSLANRVEAADDLELLAHGLSICCFRAAPPGVASDQLDALNSALITRIQLGGHAFISGTQLDGTVALRACIINPGTSEGDLESFVTRLREQVGRLIAA